MLTPRRSMMRTVLPGIAALALAACGGEDELPPPGSGTTTTTTGTGGGQGGGGQGGGGQGGSQGGGGQGGSQGGGGQGGSQGGGGQGGSSAMCGNGVLEPGEACDGADLQGLGCQSLGFDTGTLVCAADCTFDSSGCSGVETCQDGQDDDGDGLADCADTDCAGACANACSAPPVLPDSVAVLGNTLDHAPLSEPTSCSEASSSAVVYQITAAATGFLDVELTALSSPNLSISVRTSCESAASELGCKDSATGADTIEFLSVPIVQGEVVHVVVSGGEEGVQGAYQLLAHARTPVCGDGVQDPLEECDDGNLDASDGCSDTCAVNASEVEPNGTAQSANPYSSLFYAAVSPAGDQDVISVVVPAGATALQAETRAITANACPNGLLDSYIEVLDPTGTVVLAADDDSGAGLCAKVIAPSLTAGTYFVRVKASGGTPAFPYWLDVTLTPEVCGDGDQTPGEQCDDGNTAPGDGCSAACQLELDEAEPNDAPMVANAYSAPPWLATIDPVGDVDVVSVSVPGPASTLSASVGDAGTGLCGMNQLDSYVEILDAGGAVLAGDDDSGPGWCSFTTISGLAAGTYFVRVKAASFQPDSTFLYSLTITKQ